MINQIICVCFAAVIIGLALAVIGAILAIIDYFTKGKFKNWIINLLTNE